METEPPPDKMETLPMPNEVRQLFELLHQDVVWLHVKWRIFKQVFGTSEDRVRLLNRFAPFFFRMAQDAMSDDLIMGISRITDPASSSGKDNLSLRRLADAIDSRQHGSLRKRVDEELSSMEEELACVREVRNKRLAHRDYSVACKEVMISEDPTSDAIDRILKGIREIMVAVSLYFDATDIVYEHIPLVGDGDMLIHRIEKALGAAGKER